MDSLVEQLMRQHGSVKMLYNLLDKETQVGNDWC